ncbi:uncharacterized protein LOC143468056 [Clavelina lepadiformis]|uniref:uncharacterized protein LOC143468056 n=1 Tax=Clavelina lepadiformis TaxID=159417 RepID=UPI0040417944
MIDISDKVIRFAHDQGHTKANKETINWNELNTSCGNLQFKETSNSTKTTLHARNDESYAMLIDQVKVEPLERLPDKDPISMVAMDNALDNGHLPIGESVFVKDHYVLNVTNQKELCQVTFKPSFRNTAVSEIWWASTLYYPNTNGTRRGSQDVTRKVVSPRSKTASNAFNQTGKNFTKISLSPKFPTKFSINSIKPKKVQLSAKDRHKVVSKIPPGIKVPLEILQSVSEESGTFEVDYFLWGKVAVTVWGKPYKLRITDILDPKNNSSFERITLSNTNAKQEHQSIAEEEIQAIKFTLQGCYKCTRVSYEIKLRIPNCILRRPSYSMISLECTCDTTELPPELNQEHVLPLNNKNLAQIMFRWKQILYSFRDKHDNKETEWLWKALLCTDTALAKIAITANVDVTCETLATIDKLVVTMLLWKEDCMDLNQLGNVRSADNITLPEQWTIDLIQQLYQIGIPVPVMSFLWLKQKEISDEMLLKYTCPVHKFGPDATLDLDDLPLAIHSKMCAPLPDRVLIRLSQRWSEQDGWMSTALHLGIDPSNIRSLATSSIQFTTITEKYLTVLKLWRMRHRRSSVEVSSGSPGQCSTWDLCKELQGMNLSVPVYDFLWRETETTP